MSGTPDLFAHSPRKQLFQRIHRYAFSHAHTVGSIGRVDAATVAQIQRDLAEFAAIIGDGIFPLDSPVESDAKPPNVQPLMPPGFEAEGEAFLKIMLGDD